MLHSHRSDGLLNQNKPLRFLHDLVQFFHIGKYILTLQRMIRIWNQKAGNAALFAHAWVLNTHLQCVEFGVPFSYHQTGAKLKKGNRVFEIPREKQHEQAQKAGLDYRTNQV